jgi:cation-transporting ATPase E
VNLLCLDKTGTLTTNELILEDVQALLESDPDEVRRLLGDYCASVRTENRTIEAIRTACPGSERTIRAEVPFSSARKWSALALDGGVYVLGAPEMLQPALRDQGGLRAQWEEQAAAGLRVLLFAAAAEGAKFDAEEPQLPGELSPLAIVSLRDELRPEARETITQFAAAGIGIKIISGDSPETVAALARQAGFTPDLTSVSGLELERLGSAEFRSVVEKATVFGRITPEQKERIIRVLRGRGRHVAMIGDGVNDVLALKQADLAIAMRSGSQVTRSVADIVLLDDSFGTLPKAFLEGQRVRRGMFDIIRLFLVRTLSVALVILAATLVGAAFPTTPRQNGVLAFLTVGIPTLALAAWARAAQTPRRLVLSSAHFVVPAALSIAGVSFAIYQLFLWTSDGDTARSALVTTAILCGIVLIPFAQPPSRAFVGGAEFNGDWRPTFLAAAMVVLYVAILAAGPVRDFYELEVLSVPAYILIVLAVAGWALALRKFWRWNLPVQSRRLWRWLME